MKAGVSTASLFMRKNNEDALPLLNELGVEIAEVFLTSFSEYGYPFAELLNTVDFRLLFSRQVLRAAAAAPEARLLMSMVRSWV